MATVFWDAVGVIYIDFLEAGTTISSRVLYCNIQNFETVIK
jgi:hypothetical protein